MHNTPKKITSFRGKYAFLSNFYERPIKYRDIVYGSSEAAYQAQKFLAIKMKYKIAKMKPHEAKREGAKSKLPDDVNPLDIMYKICKAKFTQHPDLKKRLLQTGDIFLEEGNDWGDKYWGTCNGKGSNNLGRILMRIRNELREEESKRENLYGRKITYVHQEARYGR